MLNSKKSNLYIPPVLSLHFSHHLLPICNVRYSAHCGEKTIGRQRFYLVCTDILMAYCQSHVYLVLTSHFITEKTKTKSNEHMPHFIYLILLNVVCSTELPGVSVFIDLFQIQALCWSLHRLCHHFQRSDDHFDRQREKEGMCVFILIATKNVQTSIRKLQTSIRIFVF